jgi:hypothetical protein
MPFCSGFPPKSLAASSARACLWLIQSPDKGHEHPCVGYGLGHIVSARSFLLALQRQL